MGRRVRGPDRFREKEKSEMRAFCRLPANVLATVIELRHKGKVRLKILLIFYTYQRVTEPSVTQTQTLRSRILPNKQNLPQIELNNTRIAE